MAREEGKRKTVSSLEHWKNASFSELMPISHEGPGYYHGEGKHWQQHHREGGASWFSFTSISYWPILHL